MTTPTNSKCEIILLDGGLGTTLTSPPYNITFTTSTPLWSSHLLISSPSTLLAAQTSFVTTGADVVITATYQASFEGFKATGYGDRKEVERLMRSAVGLAREAFVGKGKGIVALSLGAYGAVMVPSQEYSGVYDEGHWEVEGLRDWHSERVSVFLPDEGVGEEETKERRGCWDNVDLVAFETLPRLQEIIAARECMSLVEKAVEGKERKPFWISCVFPLEGNTLPDGSGVKDVVEAMLGEKEGSARPMGVGINCTKVGKLESLVLEFEKEAGRIIGEGGEKVSLVLYPDGTKVGERYNTTTKEWEVSEEGSGGGSQKAWDEEVFDIVTRARERGVWKSIYAGGCCRTGPEEIGRLRKRIDEQRQAI